LCFNRLSSFAPNRELTTLIPGQVRGAGHMVPQMKPAASLEMIGKWLADEPWLQYNYSRHP
jgi:carboxypeptidase C (cathepsin A)